MAYKLAQFLGVTTLGIAAVELLAPRWLQRQLGVKGHRRLVQVMGARELASGVDILAQSKPNAALAAGLWSRVLGDAIDLSLLAAARKETRNPRGLSIATLMVLGVTALDIYAAVRTQGGLNRHGQTARRLGSKAGSSTATSGAATASDPATQQLAESATRGVLARAELEARPTSTDIQWAK